MTDDFKRQLKEMIGPLWGAAIASRMTIGEARNVCEFLDEVYEGSQRTVPQRKDVFRAFAYVPPEEVRVVLIAMDPYPNVGDADGLAFSAGEAKRRPASLDKISAELKRDIGYELPHEYCSLEKWATQGVLLLNAALTTEEGSPGAHMEKWRRFSRVVLDILLNQKQNPVFILCGKEANGLLPKGSVPENLTVIRTNHVSARGNGKYEKFCGSKLFSRTNDLLRQMNLDEIDWKVNFQS